MYRRTDYPPLLLRFLSGVALWLPLAALPPAYQKEAIHYILLYSGILAWRVYVQTNPRGVCVEWNSLIHSCVAVGFSLAGLWAENNDVEQWAQSACSNSYGYFIYDLVLLFWEIPVGGFELMYAIHHLVALANLWFVATYKLDGIFASLIITEITNPLRALEMIYLIRNFFSPLAKKSQYRLRLNLIFRVGFVIMRAVVLPLYTIQWLKRNETRVPGHMRLWCSSAVSLLVSGGLSWSFMIVTKWRKSLRR